MAKMVEIICENIHSKKIYAPGITLMEIASDQKITLEHPIIGAMVNNRVQELDYQVFNPKIISFLILPIPLGCECICVLFLCP